MDRGKIRNFCIIAHIDHGKSTLADRFLEITGTIPKRKMREQYLDQMELERERGITIKLQPVRMGWKGYELNLIDTPGHVDFTYEVSRSLACVEGAILLVDATQGIEAQTISNLYLAREQNLKIIGAVNKIDMPHCDPEKESKALANLLGVGEEDILKISAKTGEGAEKLLDKIIKEVHPPLLDSTPERALIFDSQFDDYRGVIVFVKIASGTFKKGDNILFLSNKKESQILETGYFHPEKVQCESLSAGQIGYFITTIKDSSLVRVGDTVANPKNRALPLPGYREIKPMVFAGLFVNQGEFAQLRGALEKLKLSDPSLQFEGEHSPSLGYGFRAGFLGLLHIEIVAERLKREFGIDPILTQPSSVYRVTEKGAGQMARLVKTAQAMPQPEKIEKIEEPWVKLDIIAPHEYIGQIMQIAENGRAEHVNTVYLDSQRAILNYRAPLTIILKGFYDKLKSVSAGYGSLNYDFLEWRETKLEKVDILIAGDLVEEFSQLVYPDDSYKTARKTVETLKEELPQRQFEVKIQAAIGSKIIASESIKALRKDVTAKLYGGDVTRKMKLKKKQKEGKRRMAREGKVQIPTSAYTALYRKA